jgi:predicted phage terminase large subunit-like protein
MALTQLKALELLLQRSEIRKSFTRWCQLAGYEPARHHQLLISKLEAVARGEITRLMVFMPPGSAKSTYGSILFAPWFLSQHPKANVIAASHTVELAEKFGRRVRNLISEHSNTLDIGLSSDSQAAGRWALDSGGEYYAAGVGVGIAGFRADLTIIDDPVRSREDAESETVREKLGEWWASDLTTRMKPGGRIIYIATRWHEDDLAGRLLEAQAAGGEQWEVLSLPAEAEENDALGRQPGEFLWDDDSGYGDLLRHHKQTQTPRNWNALYQQRPAPETGDYFKLEWIKHVDILPAHLRVYAGADFAVTSNGGDYTAMVIVGLDPSGNLYLLDVWRKQASSDAWIEAFCDLTIKWKPIGWACETGQINSGLGPWMEKRARERGAWTHREVFPTRGDKSVRAQSIRGMMALKGLYVPNAPWRNAFIAELLSFPAGKHDDQVDAIGLVGQLLDRMMPASKPEAPKRRSTIDWSKERGVRLPGPPEPMPSFRIKI